eukprot:2968826-Amphidinium_carterae.1
MVQATPVDGWRFVAAVCLCHAAHLYFVCNIFSFGALMCVDLGWAQDRDNAGYVAGYLNSANTLGRIPTAGLWGFIADRYGYRSAVLATFSFLAIGGIAFGSSTAFALSVASRFVFWGMLNGWISLFVPLCTAAGEQQMQTLGHVLGAGQLVQTLAPAIGAWMYTATQHSTWPASGPSFVG